MNPKKQNGRTVHLSTTNRIKFGRPIYILDHEYNYVSADGGHLRTIIPAGFETDLASVPIIFSPFFPAAYKWTYIAVVHDYFYKTGCVSRKVADSIFLRERKRCGCPIRLSVMWIFLRVFGALFYHKAYNYDANKKFNS